MICRTAWEKLLMPSVGAIITLFNSPKAVNDPRNMSAAFANGQYLLFRKEAYRKIDGHKAVKGRVLEDVDLAYIAKKSGLKTGIAYGEQLFGVHMYTTIGAFVEGWTKNLFLIMKSTWTGVISVILTSILLSWVPLISLFYGVALLCCGTATNPAWIPWFLIGSYLATLFFQVVLRWKGKIFPIYALFAPLGAVMVSFIILRSAYLTTTRKGVTWKGRTYSG
jgi:chlorobactene glucosyltransferase